MNGHQTTQEIDGIAIIGMAGRFPDAPDVDALWENLRAAREGIHWMTDDQLRDVEYDFERIKNDPNYVRSRGILEGADLFDAKFFGYTPREAAVLDPQHRIWLECAWHALEDAGISPVKSRGSIGVYAGSYVNTYLLYNLCKDRDTIERMVRFRSVDAFQNIISNDKDYLPTRTSFKFDLRGPSVTVQTACSTSLVSVAQACSALANYEADICLAGGICITLPQEKGYVYQEGGMNSADGHCRPFDRKANGTVFSSGVGVVVLKRAEEALADGDRILAVLRGWAVNNDGSNKVSFPAPSVDGQAEVIALAQSVAGVEPSTITFVEGHGTATPLGDPIEFAALTKAFRAKTSEKQFCVLGSIKSNLGHLDAAAGVAGLIKAVLSLQHEEIPATLHYEHPNPEIDFANSPFYVTNQLTKWSPPLGIPRRAGVSSFGVGGTNVHVVVEEAPGVKLSEPPARMLQLFPLSAKSEAALDVMTNNLIAYLDEQSTHSGKPCHADIAATLQTGRQDFEYRRFVVAKDVQEAKSSLAGKDSKTRASHRAPDCQSNVVFMFPGQGAQHIDMCRDIYDQEEVFRNHLDQCSEILRPVLDLDVRKVLFPPADANREEATRILTQTGVAQPALFAVEYALAQQWMHWGIRPESMVGHSLGEYVAAVLADVFTLEDGIRVLAERARLMQGMPAGSMRAVRLPEKDVIPFLGDGVELAASNAPSTSIVSGPTGAIERFGERLQEAGHELVCLHTSHAFHSAMMEPALEPLTEVVRSVARRSPRIPFVSTVTGTWIKDEEATDPSYWASQLRKPVRFSAAIRELLADESRVYLEVGPSKTLSTSALQHQGSGHRPAVVPSCGHPTDKESAQVLLMTALGQLWMRGVPIDWRRLHDGEQRRRVRLPGYPFERERHWIDPPPLSNGGAGTATVAMAPASPPPQSTVARGAQEAGHVKSDRRQLIREKTRSIFYELSGIEIGENDYDSTFLEMGMDSLFLTQASAKLGDVLGERIRFRQMLEDVCTLNLLTDYYTDKLPADAFQPAPVPPALPTSTTSQTPQVAEGGAVEWVVEQLKSMQEQLVAATTASTANAPTAPQNILPNCSEPNKQNRSGQPVTQAVLSSAREKTGEAVRRFGPYAPVERARDGGLTERQERHLADLVKRLTEKTRRSKEAAARSRPFLADPRSVSGFRGIWKELVYQIVAERSQGSRIWDKDGNEYVDITMGFGVNYLGHSPPYVVDAVRAQLEIGMQIGPQSDLAEKVALGICELTGMERASFCNTGSEAVTAALRMARTVTGRDRVVYFSGDYHGVFDEVLGRAQVVRGDLQTLPAAPGILQDAVNSAMVLDYGAPQSLEIIRSLANELAAVLVEPVQSRHPELRPVDFLRELREITENSGTALIFDEVITGFRVQPGGAQAFYDIRADLATYGKVVGGGLPIGVVAGSAKYMNALDGGPWNYHDESAPEADMTFFAGTFIRHPLALAAANAVVDHLRKEGPALQAGTNARTAGFAEDLNSFFETERVPIRIRQFSSWFRFDLPQDLPFAALLGYHLLDRGVYFREPGQNCFFSTMHSQADIEHVKSAVIESVAEMQRGGFLPGGEVVDASSDDNSMELSDGQSEIWIVCETGDEASCAYNEGFHLRMRGPLDVSALERAIRRATGRHEALAFRFDPAGPTQRRGNLELPNLITEDLTHLNESDRELAIEAVFDQEASRPLDLFEGPLLRYRLLRLAKQEHLLVGCAHHIVFDGWSCSVLVDEISQTYAGCRRGESVNLPPAASYKDYVNAERNRRAGAEGKKALAYWTSQFDELPPPLDLPYDRPRSRIRTTDADSLLWRFDQTVYEDFKKAIAQRGVSLFTGLFAAYNVLIHRLSNLDDVVIGIMVAGQAQAGEESLIGHCVNLLPVRSRIDATTPFSEFLLATQSQLFDAYEHQDCAFGKILENLPVRRAPGRLPLMEVIFNLDRDVPGQGFDGLDVSIRENPKTSSHFDMFLNLNEQEGGLEVKLDYLTDPYDEATMRRWMSMFESIMRSVADDPSSAVVDLNTLSAEEQNELLPRRNETNRPYRSDTPLHTLFEEQVDRRADSVALVVPGPDRTVQDELTYRMLDERANRLAHRLRDGGVVSGSLVAIFTERDADMLVGMLAILKAGGAYVPIDPSFPADRVRYIIKDSGASWVVTQTSLSGQLEDTAQVIDLDGEASAIAQRSAERPGVPVSSEQLAYVIYTSGSTGLPKGVEIPHRAVVNFLQSMEKEPGLEATDVWLAITTITFDISVLELMLPLITGAKIVLGQSDDAADGARLGEMIRSFGITCMQATPVTWRILIESGWEGSPDQKILCGGEAFPEDLTQKLLERCSSLWNMYGPTETTIWSACSKISEKEPISIGRPIANTQLYVLDSRREPVAIGTVGELYIGGDGIARGYHGRHDLTNEKFIPNPFGPDRLYQTGDLARPLLNGTIQVLGRTDSQVKLHGYRVELGEVEARLGKLEEIESCAATVFDDGSGGRHLVAYCVAPGAELEPSYVRRRLAETLPEYMIPSYFMILDALPLTPNQKVDRKALPPPDPSALVSSAEYVAARNSIEEKLVELWADTLNQDKVSVTADFFDLGGHSLMAARMLTRAREAFDVDLSLRGFFADATIAGLAEYIEAQRYVTSSRTGIERRGHDQEELEI